MNMFMNTYQHIYNMSINMNIYMNIHKNTNPNQTVGGGANGPPCRKIAISPEPNLRWTSDQSVNSSLSIVVQ